MRLRLVLLTVSVAAAAGGVLAALAPHDGTAGATATAPTTSAPQLSPSVRRAVALIDDPRRFGYRIVVAADRRALRGRLDARARTITLFVDPRDAPHRIAHDLAHELGHAYDLAHLTTAGRTAYLRRRGAPGATWWARAGRPDYAVGAGDFAEVYALCHAASPEFRSRLAAPPADPCGMLPPGARTQGTISG